MLNYQSTWKDRTIPTFFFKERLNQPMVRQWLTVAAWSPSNLSKTKAGPWQFRRGLSGDAENDGTDLRHEGAAQE